MKNGVIIAIITIVIAIGLFTFNSSNNIQTDTSQTPTQAPSESSGGTQLTSLPNVIPITHASLILDWNGTVIYADPTGNAEAYEGQPAPNIIVVTDIHGDHMSAETLEAVIADATLVVPQAVKDELPASLAEGATVIGNGENITVQGVEITAIPMYNLPESAESRHTKGRGNGYVLEKEDTRVYIAGDTSGISEMKALTNINIAFVPMNLPFTMSVEEAAEAVLAFKPLQVYPFHYRGQNGLADINKFKELVNAGDPNIDVVLLDWYKE